MKRLTGIEVWDGKRTAAVALPEPDAVRAALAAPVRHVERLGEIPTLTLRLHAGSAAATTVEADGEPLLRRRRLLRLVYDDGSFGEYRIREFRRDASGDAEATVEARHVSEDLAGSLVRRILAGGAVSYTVFFRGRDVADALAEVLSADLGCSLLFAPGTVDAAFAGEPVDLAATGEETHLDLVREIANQLGAEIAFRYDGVAGVYRVDVVERVGGDPDPALRPVEIGPGTACNRVELEQLSESAQYFDRIVPLGGTGAETVTIGQARWEPSQVVQSDGTDTTLAVPGGAVYKAGALVGTYFGAEGVGFFEVYLTGVGDGDLCVVAVHGGGATALVGERCRFAADAAGTELTHLADPDAGAAGARAKALRLQDVVPHGNVLYEHGVSADLSTWAAGLPVGVESIAAPDASEPTVQEEAGDIYVAHGTRSARIICTKLGQGIRTAPLVLAPTQAEPFHSVWIAVRVDVGGVRVELVSEDDGTVYPQGEQATSNVADLREVLLEGLNVPAGTYRLRIVATQDAADFALDAWTLTQSAGAYPFAEEMGPRALWRAGARHLLEEGGLLPDAFEGAAYDVSAFDDVAYAPIELGSFVQVRDGYNPDDGGFDIAFTSRVVELVYEEDAVDGAVYKEVTLSRSRKDFADRFVPPSERPRLRPLQPTPFPPKPTVQVEVSQAEVEGVRYGVLRLRPSSLPGVTSARARTASGRNLVDDDDLADMTFVDDADPRFEATVALTPKHTSAIEWRVDFDVPFDADAQALTGTHTFDFDALPELTAVAIEWSDYDAANDRYELFIRYQGDEDADALAYAVRDDAGGGAYDPESAVDGDLTDAVDGRTGRVATGVYAAPGEVLYVLAKAARAGGDAEAGVGTANVEVLAPTFAALAAAAPYRGLNWRGTWTEGTTYRIGDVVAKNGGSYVALQDHTAAIANQPAAAGFWDELAAAGEDGDDGRSLVWEGSWSSSSVYYGVDDLVLYQGSAYICVQAHTSDGGKAPTNVTYWDLVAKEGEEGPPGAGLEWEGEWTSGTTYYVNEAVSYQGSAYVCVLQHTASGANAPPNATYWSLMASRGEDAEGNIKTVTTKPAGYDGAKFVYVENAGDPDHQKLFRWNGSAYVAPQTELAAQNVVAATLSAIVAKLGTVDVHAGGALRLNFGGADGYGVNQIDLRDDGATAFGIRMNGSFAIELHSPTNSWLALQSGTAYVHINALGNNDVLVQQSLHAGGYGPVGCVLHAEGRVSVDDTAASSASAGAATLPSNPVEFMPVLFNGNLRYAPLYS